MQRSTSRILTTHTGSLPRWSPQLQDLLREREEQGTADAQAFEAGVRAAVAEVVGRQAEIGLDMINDGEQGRAQYATYVKERLSGFDGRAGGAARAPARRGGLSGIRGRASAASAIDAATRLHGSDRAGAIAKRSSNDIDRLKAALAGRRAGGGLHDGALRPA